MFVVRSCKKEVCNDQGRVEEELEGAGSKKKGEKGKGKEKEGRRKQKKMRKMQRTEYWRGRPTGRVLSPPGW